MPSLSPYTALLVVASLAFAQGCVVRFEDDDDDDWNLHENGSPEVDDAWAECNQDLTVFSLWAEVSDPDGASDVAHVTADAWEVYPDKSEDYVGQVDLFDQGEGYFDAEVDSDYEWLNCDFQYTYCFDFVAYDYQGATSEPYVVCN